MKKLKLLTILTALPILGSSLIPLTSCGGKEGKSTDAISCLTSKTLQIESGKSTDFKFKFEAKPYDSKVTVTIANSSTTQPQVNFIDATTQEASTTIQATVDSENKFTLHIGFVEAQTTTCESKFNLTFSYKKDDTQPTTNFQIQGFSLKFVDPTTIMRTVKFTITGGGRMEGDLQTQVQNGKTWADVTKPSPIDSLTVTFAGWYNGETEMKDTDVISSDLNITAKFITCTPTSCFNFSTGSGGATLISCNQSEIYKYQDIVLPEMVTISGTSYKVNEFADGAFDNAKLTMKQIVISKNITTINASLFNGFTKLNKVILPDGLNTIGNSAFYNCSSMTTITIPSSVTSIGANAFGVSTSETSKWTCIHFNEKKYYWNVNSTNWGIYFKTDVEIKNDLTSTYVSYSFTKTSNIFQITVNLSIDDQISGITTTTIDCNKDYDATYTINENYVTNFNLFDVVVYNSSIKNNNGISLTDSKLHISCSNYTKDSLTIVLRARQKDTYGKTISNSLSEVIKYCNNYEKGSIDKETFAKSFNTDIGNVSSSTDLIGKEIPILINTQVHYVRIIDIDHDILASDESKKAALTFDMATLLSDSNGNEMSSKWDSSKNYDYTNSILRANLTGNGSGTKSFDNTVFSMLPPELQSSIKTVNKKVATYDNETENYIVKDAGYIDKLFPLTYTEMAQTGSSEVKVEGSAYTYWTNNNTNAARIKKDVNGNACVYWLCSPYIANSEHAWGVKSDGSVHTYGGGGVFVASGVSFGFCI